MTKFVPFISALLLGLVLISGVPAVFASETSSFDVFDVLDTSTGSSTEPSTGEEIIQQAEERGTSVVGILILRAINILSLLVGTFAFVMIIVGGFMLGAAMGDESRLDRGKAIITQAIVGLEVAFLAYFIVTFIQSFFY